MISSPWLLLALFLAIAAGFFLGRMETRRRRRLRRGPRGLPTFLSRDTTTSPRDHALEALLSSTDTDPDTVDTHLAMGRLFRKRGELERATRLHQRMADNPELPETVREDAALELARDYLSAGLLDRAEALLQHMVDHGNRHAPLAMRQLMMLFEQERDWHSALSTGERLLRRDASVAPVLAHYCCELAERLNPREENARRRLLHRALTFDPGCARASMLQGQLERAAGHPERALRAFRRVRRQAPQHLPLVLNDLAASYQDLEREDELFDMLLDLSLAHPSSALLRRLIPLLVARGGEGEAVRFLTSYLQQHPSLEGLGELAALALSGEGSSEALAESGNTQARAQEQSLRLLRALTERSASTGYQCSQCGYRATKMHWHCPSCKHWNTLAP